MWHVLSFIPFSFLTYFPHSSITFSHFSSLHPLLVPPLLFPYLSPIFFCFILFLIASLLFNRLQSSISKEDRESH
jgi:hypothetical protein